MYVNASMKVIHLFFFFFFLNARREKKKHGQQWKSQVLAYVWNEKSSSYLIFFSPGHSLLPPVAVKTQECET